MKGNRFLLSTFDGSSSAKTWTRRLVAFFLLHPMVEREAVEIAALHMKGKASTWWFSHIIHKRVSTLVDFTQRVIKRFDEEKSKRENPSSPLDETYISVVTTLEEQPSCSMEEDTTIKEEALASTSHQGMIEDSSIVISAHCMKRYAFLYAADLEQQSCTALCKSSKEERKHHSSWGHSNCSFTHEAMEEEMMNSIHLEVRNLFSFLDASFSMSTPQLKEKLLPAEDPKPQWF